MAPPVRKKSFISMEEMLEHAEEAIHTVGNLVPLLSIGPPIIHRGPEGEMHVDIPLMYDGVALDRIHFDPLNNSFSPKGRPVHAFIERLDVKMIRKKAEELLSEIRVIDFVEYREPENCWVVPIGWRAFIIAHVKVDFSGKKVIQDIPLSAEIGGKIV